MDRAEELFLALQSQPTNQVLSDDMGNKQEFFVNAIGRNANQRRKVDEMFKTTRDLLFKHINPKMLNDLEKDLITARKNGGKFVRKIEDDDEGVPAERGK